MQPPDNATKPLHESTLAGDTAYTAETCKIYRLDEARSARQEKEPFIVPSLLALIVGAPLVIALSVVQGRMLRAGRFSWVPFLLLALAVLLFALRSFLPWLQRVVAHAHLRRDAGYGIDSRAYLVLSRQKIEYYAQDTLMSVSWQNVAGFEYKRVSRYSMRKTRFLRVTRTLSLLFDGQPQLLHVDDLVPLPAPDSPCAAEFERDLRQYAPHLYRS